MIPAPALVKVRVQARDGKILGPAKTVKQPTLSVRDVRKDEYVVIPNPNFDTRSSGTVVAASQFTETVSRNAIVVEPSPLEPPPPVKPPFPDPGPQWLQMPPSGEGELIVSLPLTEPSLLEFKATAYAPDAVYASATMWVMPGMQLLADPGLVLTIAGLYTTIDTTIIGGLVKVTAMVTMMCGCPITVPPPAQPPPDEELYWPATELEVYTQVRAEGSQNVSPPLLMTFEDTNTFTRLVSVAPGTHDVWVVAVQRRETNVGYAATKVVVP